MKCREKRHFPTEDAAYERLREITLDMTADRLYQPVRPDVCRCGRGGYVLTSHTAKTWAKGKRSRR
jgi:hypothetical protein